ncbi:MAG TPA: adenylate/guanylate cyclase domain-containing protein [Terriglobales bacterium]|nr:adenylate/guanylate cyclase domain-containing protein [Terriglobales bacterium]
MAEPPAAPFLKFEEGDGREIPLISGHVWKIGRAEQNAVALIDDMVSRNHAMIQMEGGEFYLIDMGSRNGSFVNGSRLAAPAALRDGDLLGFGKARLRFHNPAQAAQSAPPDSLLKQAVVSVLVVEIRGFAALAEKADREVAGKLLSTWFAEADRLTRHYGSTAEKPLGDRAMAVWTHGAKGQEHIEVLRILRAALEIAQVTATLHESFGLAEALRTTAGVNTGLAAIGHTDAGGFTAIGDSVDAAFRLESAATELEADVVLGASTFDYVRLWPGAAQHFRSSEMKLPDRDAPVKTWHSLFPELNRFLGDRREDLAKTITGRTIPL